MRRRLDQQHVVEVIFLPERGRLPRTGSLFDELFRFQARATVMWIEYEKACVAAFAVELHSNNRVGHVTATCI